METDVYFPCEYTPVFVCLLCTVSYTILSYCHSTGACNFTSSVLTVWALVMTPLSNGEKMDISHNTNTYVFE